MRGVGTLHAFLCFNSSCIHRSVVMDLSHAGGSSRTQGAPALSTQTTRCSVCHVLIQERDLASSWTDLVGTTHYICVGCHDAGNQPFFDAGVHQRNVYERAHIAAQVDDVMHRIHALESECTRLAVIQEQLSRELDGCKQNEAYLVARGATLQTYVERGLQAQMYSSRLSFGQLHRAGVGSQVARTASLDVVGIAGNVSPSNSETLITKMQIGLTELMRLASVWTLMSAQTVEDKGAIFCNNVKLLVVKSSFSVGDKCLQYANVLGVTENVFLAELVRQMVYCDVFAKNVTSFFRPRPERSNTTSRTKNPTPVLLVQLHKSTIEMITDFSSNLFTVNISEASSAGTFIHDRSAVVCAFGIVYASEYVDESDMSDGEVLASLDYTQPNYTRISPHITQNVGNAPLLSFQVPKNKAFSLYLFNLSDADLCVLKGTVLGNQDRGSTVIEGDSLISHQYSSRKYQPDTNVPANGVSLVLLDMHMPQHSITEKYDLKDANNNIFLRVETSLAMRADK